MTDSASAVSQYSRVRKDLLLAPKTWLITGVAGFIGSNLLEHLLKLEQRVIGLDNFSTGYRRNLEAVRRAVDPKIWSSFSFIEGDITKLQDCVEACKGVDFILHQAALGSVPRSIEDPITTNLVNVSGFLNILSAARDSKVRRFIYAASSSTYGDHIELPKVESRVGRLLSPYAVSKAVNELYADVFNRIYGLDCVGLRYFNVFGPRQDPDGAYAAVIPKWTKALIKGDSVYINGDGKSSRDFCYVDNVVQANLLAAVSRDFRSVNQVYNVAVGDCTTLNELYTEIQCQLRLRIPDLFEARPIYRDFRQGDVRHSLADVSKAAELLGYSPTHRLRDGLSETVEWFLSS